MQADSRLRHGSVRLAPDRLHSSKSGLAIEGARRLPEIIASGRIEDWCAVHIPLLEYIGRGGEFAGCAQVLSYRSVSLLPGLPVRDRHILVVPVDEHGSPWGHSDLREAALDAAQTRADLCINRYVYFFLVDDGGAPKPNSALIDENLQPTERSMLVFDPGYQEPPGILADEILYYINTPDRVAWEFSQRIYAATRRIWEPTPARLRIIRPPPRLGVAGDTVPSICGQCGRGTWFRPCCDGVFCRHCSPATPHRDGCAGQAPSVPVPPIFRTEAGERVPSIYVELHYPIWQQYRFVSGDRYVLCSYYYTADAYFFDARRGIRFQVHLYRREGPGRWGYRLEFLFLLRPRGNIEMRWYLYVAGHYVSLWPGLVDGLQD